MGGPKLALLLLAYCCVSSDVVNSQASGNCENDWVRLGSVCYLVNTTMYLTWDDAREFCMNSGGRLAEPVTQEENNMILEYNASIGCNDGLYFGLRKVNGEFRFASDNQTVVYSGWGKGQPDNYNGVEDCVHYKCFRKVYAWNDKTCTAKLSPICEMKDTITTTTTPAPAVTTPPTTTAGTTGNSDTTSDQDVTTAEIPSAQNTTHAESAATSSGPGTSFVLLGPAVTRLFRSCNDLEALSS